MGLKPYFKSASQGFKERNHVKRNTVKMIALALFALALGTALQAQDKSAPPTTMV